MKKDRQVSLGIEIISWNLKLSWLLVSFWAYIIVIALVASCHIVTGRSRLQQLCIITNTWIAISALLLSAKMLNVKAIIVSKMTSHFTGTVQMREESENRIRKW